MPKQRGRVILYDHVPDDVFQLLMTEQSKMSIKLNKRISISYVITKLLRNHEHPSELKQ